MIARCLRLIRKYPNVLVFHLGLWIAVAPIGFVRYVEDYVWMTGVPPTGLNAILCDIHNLPYAERIAVAVFFLGAGTSVAAIVFMLKSRIRPWLRPK
jgi:hypothetical protein